MNLLRAASTVSLLTLASRVTGLARELFVAANFGASAATDAFNVAFRIPNLLRRLFAEGAFSQAFVPILAESRSREGDDAEQGERMGLIRFGSRVDVFVPVGSVVKVTLGERPQAGVTVLAELPK